MVVVVPPALTTVAVRSGVDRDCSRHSILRHCVDLGRPARRQRHIGIPLYVNAAAEYVALPWASTVYGKINTGVLYQRRDKAPYSRHAAHRSGRYW